MAGNKDAFQKLMNQGHNAAWDQSWEKAADFYRSALEEMPDHPQALSSLGLALFELKDYQGSLQHYQKAASLTPDDAVPQEKIARIFEKMGRLNEAVSTSLHAAELHLKSRSAEKAIDNWLRVLALQPEHINVRTRLAAVYEKMGRREDAIAEYIAVASILQRSGDLTRATKAVECAHKIMPENQEVRLALSMIRSNRPLPHPNRLHGGFESVQSASTQEANGKRDILVEGEPDPITETRQKSVTQLASLLFDQAEENSSALSSSRGKGMNALTRGIAEAPGNGSDVYKTILHLGQAIDSLTQDDDQQVVVELEHALNLGLRQPSAYFILGLLMKDSNTEKAAKYLQQAVKHPDYALSSNLLLAQIHEKSDRWQEAATSYFQALALADAQVVTPSLSDELLSQYDSLIDSQSSVSDTTALQTTCKTISNQLVRSDWRRNLQKARQNMDAASDGFPPTPVAEMLLETRNTQVAETMARVRSLASKGMLRSAFEDAHYALQLAPTYLPLHVLIGDLLLQSQRTHEAVQKYLVITDLYMVRGEVSRAIRLLKRVSQIMPSDVNVRQRIIDLLAAQGKTDDAVREYWNLAELYYNLADLDKARQTYLEALKVAQVSKENRKWGINILLKVADIDMQRLNLRQALRIYEQIRTMQPDHATARAQLIGINFRLSQDASSMKELDEYVRILEKASRHQDAIKFINEVLVDHPDRPDLRKRLADLYIRNNEIGQAVSQLDAVADSLLAENKNIEAVNMLETIISLNPPNVQEYRAALETLRRDMLRK